MKRRVILLLTILFACLLAPLPARADVKDTVRETILRLKREQPKEVLRSITPAQVAKLLTPEERTVLGEQYLTFRVNVPVTVFVAMDPELKDDEFWLPERGFQQTDAAVTVGGESRLVWRKDFPAGPVGLGVHSLSRRGNQYFVVVVPQSPGDSVSVTGVNPPSHTLGVAKKGERIVADRDDVLTGLPADLDGRVLIRGYHHREQEAHIAGFFRSTSYPSSDRPDEIIVTVAQDPSSSMSVQWRTGVNVSKGIVRYQEKGTSAADKFVEVPAETIQIDDPGLIEDAVNSRHFATLKNLVPGTAYRYSVGDGSIWSEPAEFTTAPAGDVPFSFLYMGDIQSGYDKWQALAKRAMTTCPEAAFCLTTGDQANRGGERSDWDSFFNEADDIFGRLPMAPAMGNHEIYADLPRLYLDLFDLPRNGPAELTPERAYSFECGNALFVVLDGNSPPEKQASWLRERLASSKAVWKFAAFHQPLYPVAEGRADVSLQRTWGCIFDEFGVDVAFEGHDHGYLRTFPMKDGRRAEGKGTVYLVSNAGMKMYDTAPHDDYAAIIIGRTPMYQVVQLLTKPHRLVYKAYDGAGNKLDEFTIEKGS